MTYRFVIFLVLMAVLIGIGCAQKKEAAADPQASAVKERENKAQTVTEQEKAPVIDEFIEVDETPKPIKQVSPVYPEMARKEGIQGTVWVKALVGPDGTVKDLLVGRSGGSKDLDSSALAAVRQWTFTPAKKDQEPVTVWVMIPVKFRLK